MIHNLYNEGGDGLLFWTLNHDNYYYSTDVNGTMDDGYGFYLSDDLLLANKSESIIDAINFTKYDNAGGSWITELNNYKYDFVFNIGFASDTLIDNCTLFLNVSNGTDWTDYYADQSNTSAIVYDDDYTFTTQFDSDDEEFYWYTECYGDSTTITSDVNHVQVKSATPIINLVSPGNNTSYNTDALDFFYNVINTIDISFCELYIDEELNKTDYSVSLDINQSFSVSDFSDATYNWSVKCTDTDSNEGFSETRTFIIDATSPYFITIPENTTITYPEGFGVQFNATDNIEFDTYAINWTTLFTINSTGYLKNSTTIGVGVYEINVIINDTSNNINSTTYKVTVNKGTPIGSLTNTDTWTEPYLESVTIGLSESNPGDDDLTYIVYRDRISKGTGETVTLGVDTYDYVLNTTGGANWTTVADMDSETLTITKLAPTGTLAGTSPIDYLDAGDVEGTETNTGDDDVTYKLYIEDIETTNPDNDVLGAGVWNYIYNTTGGDNYSSSASLDTFTLTVDKATPIGSISGTTPIFVGTASDVEGTETNTGDDDVTYKLYIEDIETTNPDNDVLGAGVWNYIYNSTAGANYSLSASLDTFELVVSAIPPVPSPYDDLTKSIAQILQALIVLAAAIIIMFLVKSLYRDERTLAEVIKVGLLVGLFTFILILLMPIMVSYIADLIN